MKNTFKKEKKTSWSLYQVSELYDRFLVTHAGSFTSGSLTSL